jgi:hypothetical protein
LLIANRFCTTTSTFTSFYITFNEHCYSATKNTASVNVASANGISADANVAITTANSAADNAVKMFSAPSTVYSLLLWSSADATTAIATAFATIIASEAALSVALRSAASSLLDWHIKT